MGSLQEAERIIAALGLRPLPGEGGLYCSTWVSALQAPAGGPTPPGHLSLVAGAVCPPASQANQLAPPGARPAGSAIYYMLVGDAFSHLHRLDTDEIYHFYAGDPVELLMLGCGAQADGFAAHSGPSQPPSAAVEAGREAAQANCCAQRVILGANVLAGQRPQQVVPAGAWQGSRLAHGGAWALMGTTMAPAYSEAGYTQGDRAALLAGWPAWRELITALTGPQPGPQAHGAGETASQDIYP